MFDITWNRSYKKKINGVSVKTRLSVLSNGDCVSLDDVRAVRILDRDSSTRAKVEVIYTDGIIIHFLCIGPRTAMELRDEIVSIVNEFEIDIKEQKEAEKLEKKVKESPLTPIDVEVK